MRLHIQEPLAKLGFGTADVYGVDGASLAGTGIFAAAFMEKFPLTPVADEDMLRDPKFREKFMERVREGLSFGKP